MILTYDRLPNIKFPVYKLPNMDYVVTDGLVFLGHLLLDDRNMPGSTLGMRRLQTPRKDILFKLKKGLPNAKAMLKSGHSSFIDSSGRIFMYTKTKYQDLKFYGIRKVERKDTFSLLWLHGASYPIEIERPPPHGANYASVLHFAGAPWVVWDFAHERGKDTRRMV